MPVTAQHLLGQLADGRFPLRKLLGVSPNSAVFLTSVAPARPSDPPPDAAIKLIPEDPANSDNRLARWRSVAALTHPGILKILHSGRCVIDGSPCLYVVTELADEDLSQLLPQRVLTPEETRGMLAPVLAALDFLHETGLVHAGLKPSNIHAIGDNIKLSADRICPTGESASAWPLAAPYAAPESILFPASDVWSLGFTLCETLSKTLPVRDETGKFMLPDLPAPFPEVVRTTLVDDPTLRATLDNVRSFLDPSFVSKRKVAPASPVAVSSASSDPNSASPAVPAAAVSSETSADAANWSPASADADSDSIPFIDEDDSFASGGDDAAIIEAIESPRSMAARSAQITATQPSAAETHIEAEQSRAAAAAAGASGHPSPRPQIDPLPDVDPLSVRLSHVSPAAAAPASRSRIPVESLPQVNATIGNSRRSISPNPAPRSNKLFLTSAIAVVVLAAAFLLPRYIRQAESPASSTSAANRASSPSAAPAPNPKNSPPTKPAASDPAPANQTPSNPIAPEVAPPRSGNAVAPPVADSKNSVAADPLSRKSSASRAPSSESPSSPSVAPEAPASIVNQVIPEVSAKARSTISGTVRINVRVQLNPDGSVSSAELDTPASSQFFANLALSAARQWRFTQSSPPSVLVRFEFTKSATTASLP